MVRNSLVGVALLLSSGVVGAAPFLVCDPYPSTAQQPTEFVVTVSGVATPVVTPAVDVTGGKGLRLDLASLNLSGPRNVTARARNVWGESVESAPLNFVAGPPNAPIGFGLLPQ